jgi:hypothetical protein
MTRVAYRVAYQNPSRVSQALQSSLHQLEELSNKGIRAREIFTEFFKLFPGRITIQTFDDKKHDKKLARIFHFEGDMPTTMMENLLYMNDHGAGIYFSVNETDGKGRERKNVVKVRAVFADLDGVPLSEPQGYKPTLVVESSKGKYHCYWFTEDTPLDAFTTMQKILVKKFSSDNKCVDLPRVLRVPGFYHHKGEPFMTGVQGGYGMIYPYRELVEMFPPEPVEKWSAKKYHLDTKSEKSDDKPYRGVYGTLEGDRNNHILRHIGGMLKRGKSWDYIENEAMKEAVHCSPPVPESEVQQILKSARRYL